MVILGPVFDIPLAVCAGAAALCWALNVLTEECSWVDRLWSILPPVYAWLFAVLSGLHPRAVLMAVLATAWGVRLTYNFARKGGYARGGEDYRWQALRELMPPWAFQVFSLLFIAGYQNALIFGFTLPAYVVAVGPRTPLNALDLLFTALFVAALVGETVADQQQWSFHQKKKAARARGEAPEELFLTQGLFAYSRHPNFFFEQSQWWIFTLFAIAAGLPWLNFGVAGVTLLTMLFDGSSRFTEFLTVRKYPTYREYQSRVSRMIPWFASRKQ
ncbi:MAG: DUF1295 domain-containing protein [Deltaproteobacteria bacterium]|nr:DUF1295 domain-containing protein [Deltaproteobacteria bacterium]